MDREPAANSSSAPSPRSDLIQQLITARAARPGSSDLDAMVPITNHDGFIMAVT
jgi:hypothetical protein